jgi:hypothetical protein
MVADRPVKRIAQNALLPQDGGNETERCKKSYRKKSSMCDGSRPRQMATRPITGKEYIHSQWNSCDGRRLFEQKSCTQERTGGEKLRPRLRRTAAKRNSPGPNDRKIH